MIQALARGRGVRQAAAAEAAAAVAIAAWWRSLRSVNRFRLVLRPGVVAFQAVVRGRIARREVASRWLALGRRLLRQKGATTIQVCLCFELGLRMVFECHWGLLCKSTVVVSYSGAGVYSRSVCEG